MGGGLNFNCCCDESPAVDCPDLCDWSVNRRMKITATAGTPDPGCPDTPPGICCDDDNTAGTFFLEWLSNTQLWLDPGGNCRFPSGAGDAMCTWHYQPASGIEWWGAVYFDGALYWLFVTSTGGGGGPASRYSYSTATLSDICNGGLTINQCSNDSFTCTYPATITVDWVP